VITTAAFAIVDSSPHYRNTYYQFTVSFTTMNPLPDDSAIRLIFAGVTTQDPTESPLWYCEITGLTEFTGLGV